LGEHYALMGFAKAGLGANYKNAPKTHPRGHKQKGLNMGLGSLFARPLAWGVVVALLLAINPARFIFGAPDVPRYEALDLKAPLVPPGRPAASPTREQPTVIPTVLPAPIITPAQKQEQTIEKPPDVPEQMERPALQPETSTDGAVAPRPSRQPEREPEPASRITAQPAPIVTTPDSGRASPPKQVSNAADDLPSAMLQATQIARYHLPRFMNAALSTPDSWTTSGVLIRISDGGVSEDLWVENFVADDTLGFVGTLTNAATKVPNRAAGAKLIFSVDQIQDWGFVSGGKGYGYFTAHAELPFLSAERRAGLRVFLATEPVPPGWDED
jgi:uncharacterized protein YegJ (DUF2314 family)